MCSIGVSSVPYVDSIREALFRSLTLVDSPCQHIDGYSKPEIELQNSKELLLDPIELHRSEQERVIVERSLNSVRINVQVCNKKMLVLVVLTIRQCMGPLT